jgi:transcriptional regulator with XRE-family HTH domain
VFRPAGRVEARRIDEHVGKRMRERRLALGINAAKIGKAADCSGQQMSKYELAQNRISAGRLSLVAEALGVSVDYFFEGFAETVQ